MFPPLVGSSWSRVIPFLLVSGCALFAFAGVPVEQKVALMVEALQSDSEFVSKKGQIIVGLVYKGDVSAVDQQVKALKSRGVEVNAIPFSSTADLVKRFDNGEFNVIYVHQSMVRAFSSIMMVSRGKKVLTMCEDSHCVKKGGGLGVLDSGKLFVNVRALMKVGLALDQKVLEKSVKK